MKRLFFFAALLLAMNIYSEEYRFVMNSGFYTSVSKMHYDEDTRYLVTISDNGQLLILDTISQRVIKKYTLSSETIVDASFNSEYSEVALVTVKNFNFQLELWDWHRGVKLYEKTLNEKPLFAEYTLSGNSLVFGKSGRPSITFIDHQSGNDLSKMTDSTQLFQNVYIGASGKTIMGYNLSGSLQYLQISTGKELGRVETKSGLKNLFVLQTGDKTIALAEDSQGFILINRQTGEVLDSLSVKDLSTSSIDSKNSQFSFIKRERGNQYFYQYDLSGGSFDPVHNGLNLGQSTLYTSMESLDGICYLGTSEGEFYLYFLDTQEVVPFFNETVLGINNIAVFNQSLYIASNDKLIRLESPFLNSNDHWEDLNKIKQTNQVYPNTGDYKLWYNGSSLLAYSQSSLSPSPLLRTDQDGLLGRDSNMAETLFYANQIDQEENSLLVVKDKSSVNIYDLNKGEISFQWIAPSIEKSLFIDDSNILLGKSLSPDSNGDALESLNIETGEISPVENDLFHILDFNNIDDKIYVLGLKESSGSIFMVLTRYDNQNLRKERDLVTLEYEDYSSKIYDHEGMIFIPLSGLGFISFDGRKSRTVETDKDIMDMQFINDKMIVLYEDESIGFRDMGTLFEEVNMTFFSDYSWVAIYNDYSNYLYTPEARDNFFVYRVIKR